MYGDDVNIAARLETLAEPGGICASHVVHDQVRDKLGLSFGDLGAQQVENIARPVRAYRILLGTTAAETHRAAAVVASPVRPRPQKPTIAVLPFANMSDDADQKYFSEGLAEDIITKLSRNRALVVTSRRTAFAYKGPAIDNSRVAGEFDVHYLLEGRIRCAGNRVRVTAQLLAAETGDHLWAERYDRELADLFDWQDEISQSINGAIVPAIMSAELRQAQRRMPASLTPGPASCGRIGTSANSPRVPSQRRSASSPRLFTPAR